MASQVVELLTASSLQQRLSATDLLDQWVRPVGHLDPWTSVSADDLATLRKWSASAKPRAATQPVVTDELDALIAAPTEIDARAVRERLVRYGETILPQVADRLKAHPDDPARERLVALRYRLVATDRLAAAWPGGFDRLASADNSIRRSAVTELGTIANADDHRLLRELFTDNDPFVREQSLKLLRTVGGAETDKALVELLNDPEPNVRAAVLKTLADSPDEALSDDLVQYVQREKDTDLLVHAVHVLQATPGDKTLDCMLGLLNHPQWRVRGEVAEGLLARLSPRDGSVPTPEQTARMHAALIKCLSDEDGYVVAKAAFTLIKSDFSGSAAPLMAAAQKRPELAVDVLKSLSDNPDIAATLAGQILTMTKSPSASVRAAALATLASAAPLSSQTVVRELLKDPDPIVSSAAVRAMVPLIQQLRPQNGQVAGLSFFGLFQTTVTVDVDQWNADFRQGKSRPPWLNDVIPELERQLNGGDARVAAAVTLCALGKEKEAWPVLTDPTISRGEAATALEWLPWDQRAELFSKLTASGPPDLAEIVNHFMAIPDPRAAAALWNMIASDDASAVGRMSVVHDALAAFYFNNDKYNAASLPDDQKKTAIDAAKKELAAGTGLQPTVALSLLLLVSPPDAATAAKNIYQDKKKNEWSRLDAFQVLLTALPTDQATQTAITSLADKPMRKASLPFLAVGVTAIQHVHGEIDLYSAPCVDPAFTTQNVTTASAVLDKATAAAVMADAIADHSDDSAAYAGYLLAQLGDRNGLTPLLRTARAADWEDPWGMLAYHAIAKINDDSLTPTLNEIYQRYLQIDKYQIPEMLETIHSMTGTNAARLAKTMQNALKVSDQQNAALHSN